MALTTDLTEINAFLACPTPAEWINAAVAEQSTILIDHAHCEKKAAASALNLMFRYVEHDKLLQKLSRLAREELRHFEKVLQLLKKRDIAYQHLTPSRYAAGLRCHIRPQEPYRLIDTLIINAFIEARSCERFAVLAPYLDGELAAFYQSLLASEARHYQEYLLFAKTLTSVSLNERISFFAGIEADLIQNPDQQLRFHSGVPVKSK